MFSSFQDKFKVSVLTLFPDFFSNLYKYSLFQRAIESDLLQLKIVNIRDFSKNRHKKCDDIPYGGGGGMVMTPQPLKDAILATKHENDLVIALSARGLLLNQVLVWHFANQFGLLSKSELKNIGEEGLLDFEKLKDIPEKWSRKLSRDHFSGLVLLCGHYEGMDQRVIDLYCDLELTIGDYILSGGEAAALVFLDCISRFIPNFLGNRSSLLNESFENKLLQYPQYTRPGEFQGIEIPEVLLSGHHEKIAKWRQHQRVESTKKRRPDLGDLNIKKK